MPSSESSNADGPELLPRDPSKKQPLEQQLPGQQPPGQQPLEQQLFGQQLFGQQLFGQQLFGQQLLGQQLPEQQPPGWEVDQLRSHLLKDVRLFIATPAYAGLITTGYLQSLLAAKSRLETLGATVVVETISNESLIARARNACLARFMAAGIGGRRFTHLMFIDADVSFPADAIERLLLSGEPVTAGCYPLKGVDWERLIELARQGQLRNMSAQDAEAASLHYALNCNLPDHLEGTFIPVLDVGAGFLCLTRGAVEALIEVYGDQTRYLNNVAGYEIPGPGYLFVEELRFYNLFESHIDPDTHLYLSEDYAFCRRWRESGGTIWLDLSSDLTHIGTHFYRGSIRRFLESLKGVPFEGESD